MQFSATSTSTHVLSTSLSIRLWNIFGKFALKMAISEFKEEIRRYDVNVFQEVRLKGSQMDMIEEVEGYEMWSVERKYHRWNAEQWGGVAIFAKKDLGLRRNARLTSADVLVVESEKLVIVGAYILPEASRWEGFAEVHPFERLAEVMVSFQDETRPVWVLGDLNARTKDKNGPISERRVSADRGNVSVRGNALIKLCEGAHYVILNGLERFGAGSGRITSYHTGVGVSVVDYVIANSRALGCTKRVEVGPERQDWSDHAEVVFIVEVEGERTGRGERSNRPRERRRRFRAPDVTELDRLAIEAMESKLPPLDRLRKLYGSAYCETNPVTVYVDGSGMSNGRWGAMAGAGVYFGPGNRKNLAVRVPDKQTNNRGEVYAVLRALQACNPHQTLVIYSDSVYAIGTLTVWAPDKAAIGWKIPNGDLLGDAAYLMQTRPARVSFKKVKAHSGNAHNDAADRLAKEGTTKPTAPPYLPINREEAEAARCRCEACEGLGEMVALEKVEADLGLPRGQALERGWFRETKEQAGAALTVQRRRLREKQLEIRSELYGRPGTKRFWNVLERLKGTKRRVLGDFTVEEEAEVFDGRMNPIDPIPSSYDKCRLELNEEVWATVSEHTEDKSPRGSFSRAYSEEEIQDAKGDLKQKLDSAVGEDRVSYKDIWEMDNDCLRALCNRCMELGGAPSAWLRTRLVGLCKKGKPKDDPNSYRAVGLESCLLKFVTLLISKRFLEWAEDMGLLPPSQNGFRAGYRTNNNVFILRTAVDKARATGKPLYAAFIDLTNAFPSTHQATLWLKLREKGAGGRVFDWIRWLYGEMSYVAVHGSETSDPFKASLGILIGDTCSPILWALYMMDLPGWIRRDEDDVVMDGVAMTNLEQADDVLLLSTSRSGLQRKLDGMYGWCSVNFMLLNTTKSVVLVFGKTPRDYAPFRAGDGGELRVVDEVVYLGFRVSSRGADMLRKHYDAKAEAAKNVGWQVWGLEQMTGALPVQIMLQLYMALVDPSLTHGCEVTPDSNRTARGVLEEVQIWYMRRAMGVGARAAISTSYTETGMMPIRYRRLLLALGFWRYTARSPGLLVHRAMREAIRIDFDGGVSWVSRFREALGLEPRAGALPTHEHLMDDRRLVLLQETVQRSMGMSLLAQVEGSGKLELLHGRKEPDAQGDLTVTAPLKLRHYLKVVNAGHRRALTKVMVSNHYFAVELLRYARPPVERSRRVCRFCRERVETPEHVWIECLANIEICETRLAFAGEVQALGTPAERGLLELREGDALGQLRVLLESRGMVGAVAEYAFVVQEIVRRVPIPGHPRVARARRRRAQAGVEGSECESSDAVDEEQVVAGPVQGDE